MCPSLFFHSPGELQIHGPGVTDFEKTTITIVAAEYTKLFRKVITLPGDVVFSKKQFTNGELHLVMERKSPDFPA
jgi:hypothetical protein